MNTAEKESDDDRRISMCLPFSLTGKETAQKRKEGLDGEVRLSYRVIQKKQIPGRFYR